MDPLQTIVVALRSTDPIASLLSLITQESIIQTHQSIDPNDLESELAELSYPAPLVSFAVAHGSLDQEEEPKIKYLCTVTREGWSPRLEAIVVKLLHLDRVGTSVDSIDRDIAPRVVLWGVERQDGRRGFEGFRGASTQ